MLNGPPDKALSTGKETENVGYGFKTLIEILTYFCWYLSGMDVRNVSKHFDSDCLLIERNLSS